MSYPYGNQATPTLPDLPYTVLQRRRGDVKGTLIPVTLNGQAVVISGWTFVFSVTLPSGVQVVSWLVQSPANGIPITTVDSPGFIIPAFNATVTAPFVSTANIALGNLIFITGAGSFTVSGVTSNSAVLLNPGLYGNASSGNVVSGTTVFQSGQVGITLLVIPSSITNNPVGDYPFYVKYETNDSSPGPYISTILRGTLNILDQNKPDG